jgi:anthranilate synthase/aminodeoxychorismate synthase-like glutamine amidotransferase
MILILDNYDSFTYNLTQAVEKLGARVEVKRNDSISAAEVLEMNPEAVILSPGPGRPEDAGNMPDILATIAGEIPVLGVCLGHQMIGLHFGAKVIQAAKLVHGKATAIHHDGKTIFEGISNPFPAGRYHSLGLDDGTIPQDLEISARAPDGEIMAVRHRELLLEGIQFHPESILTPEGEKLLHNFLCLTGEFQKKKHFPVP